VCDEAPRTQEFYHQSTVEVPAKQRRRLVCKVSEADLGLRVEKTAEFPMPSEVSARAVEAGLYERRRSRLRHAASTLAGKAELHEASEKRKH